MPRRDQYEIANIAQSTYLTLLEGLLVYFILQRLRLGGLLVHAILTIKEEGLEEVFADREAYYEVLPWDCRIVEQARQAL